MGPRFSQRLVCILLDQSGNGTAWCIEYISPAPGQSSQPFSHVSPSLIHLWLSFLPTALSQRLIERHSVEQLFLDFLFLPISASKCISGNMGLASSKTKRALVGLPFMGIAMVCMRGMDIAKLVEHQEPFLESGKIAWEDGEIQILTDFHWVTFLDDVWRGTTATFSPSTLGYDSIGRLQMFSFLVDVGTMYAVWLIESCRVGNIYTPAYL